MIDESVEDNMISQSEDKLHRLELALQNAMKVRNYERATILKQLIGKEKDIIQKHASEKKRIENLNRIEQTKQNMTAEYQQVMSATIQRMNLLFELMENNYSNMEADHLQKIEDLRDKFSKSKYNACRISPTIRNLQKAEEFYVKSQDFQSAAQIRKQIVNQTQKEAQEFEEIVSATIDAKIRDAMNAYKAQQNSFVQRLTNEKNLLKRDVAHDLLRIENKYQKLFHDLTGQHSTEVLTEPYKKEIYANIDHEFAVYMKKMQEHYELNPPEAKQSTSRTRALASQHIMSRGIHPQTMPSPRKKQPSVKKNGTSGKASKKHAETERHRAQPKRNPRVENALSRAKMNVDLAETLG